MSRVEKLAPLPVFISVSKARRSTAWCLAVRCVRGSGAKVLFGSKRLNMVSEFPARVGPAELLKGPPQRGPAECHEKDHACPVKH